MNVMSPEETLRVKLAALLQQHRALDDEVTRLYTDAAACSLDLQRLKRRKLALRDEIAALQDRITPDIIA